MLEQFFAVEIPDSRGTLGVVMVKTVSLYFFGESSPQLGRVEVLDLQDRRLILSRGALVRAVDGASVGTFSWSRAVQALTILLLRTLLHRSDRAVIPVLEGGQGSLAASLDYAISKETQWLCEMFGVDAHGRSIARRLITRQNPERKRAGPVSVSCGEKIAKDASIEVFLASRRLSTSDIRLLLTALESSVDSSSALHRSADTQSASSKNSSVPEAMHEHTIVFFSPSDGANPFYGQVLRSMAQLFPGHLTPIIPRQNFDPHYMWKHVQRYIQQETRQTGVILIPDEPEIHRETILQLHRKTNISLVLFDVDLQRTDNHEDLPSFVGGDEELGGCLAADLAVQYLQQESLYNPRVLVVRGATTEWESKRSSSFISRLLASIPGASISQTPKLRYDRLESRRYLLDLITFAQPPDLHYDLIFACNDDMALGCRAALLELQRLRRINHISTKIIGYDGIREVRELVQLEDLIILGTIDVQLDRQIDLLRRVILEQLKNPQSSSSRHLVKPWVISSLCSRTKVVGE